MISYLNRKFITNTIEEVGENCIRVRWNYSVDLPFKRGDVYNEQGEKHIGQKWLHLPVPKIEQVLRGLIDTDGCVGKEIVFDTTSSPVGGGALHDVAM